MLYFLYLQLHFSNIAIYKNKFTKWLTKIGVYCIMMSKSKLKGVLNMESKREKFVRLAEARTNKIIDMIRLLGNCANKSNYDYTDADIQKIFTAIDKELKNMKLKFSVSEVEDDKFRL